MGSCGDTLAVEIIPLSLSQQEVWLDQRAWPGSTHLNIGGAGYFDGPFDLALLQQALACMVAETEALRLVPLPEGGQRLLATYDAPLKLVNIPATDEPLAAMRAWWQAWMKEPFAFDGTPPWRFALLRHSDTLHGLTIQFHHLIMDGWGTSLVMQRWASIYNALAAGKPSPATSDSGYRAFVMESLEYRGSPACERDATFWQHEMPVLPAPLFERRYPHVVSEGLQPAHVVTQTLSRAECDRLGYVASALGTTLFGFMVAVIATYLARIYDRDEIVIGLPSLNRAGKRYRETPGMFVSVFPLVVRLRPGMTVRELIESVNVSLKTAVRHHRYPVSELARHLMAIRQHRDSIFDVIFSYERQDYDLNFGAGRCCGARQIFSGLARYPLGITLCEFQANQDAELALEASPSCFSADEVAYLGQRLAFLMRLMADEPERKVETLPLVPSTELRTLLPDVRPEPSADPYILQFERQAALAPDAVALVWEEGELDYGSLNRWADQLAQRLLTLGAGPDRVVATVIERSPEMVAAMLAISKAGAAFLPLDPDMPLARLQLILDDSEAIALLLQAPQFERFADMHAKLQVVDATPLTGDSVAQTRQPQHGDLAYVLFTSGSTGRPKGVMLEHAALARRLTWISRTYKVEPSDRTGQCTQATFDPSLIELLVPLINGASVALPRPGRLSPGTLGDFVVRHQVTILALVPSTLRGLLDSIPGTSVEHSTLKLRIACCGGEVLPAELANRFIAEIGGRLFNVYGPTETAIFATAWECSTQPASMVLPVGRAIDDTRIYILDGRHQMLPFGAVGEVYIAGPAIARGYLKQRALDSEAFLDDPFLPGERMYRSGDRGWLATDGNLHFVGRTDRQIKLRGYRIELGEIEAALLSFDAVKQVAVKLLDCHGNGKIYAWVAGSQPLQAGHIRRYLASRLPDYMLPAGISCLPELPLNSSGKIAYDLLPDPGLQSMPTASRQPVSVLEHASLALWQSVLKRNDLHVTDNFFDVGGDSLAAVDILAGMETLLGHAVPLFTLIEYPTIEQLAVRFDGGANKTPVEGVMLHLSRKERGMPLYFAASGQGDLIRFKALAEALGDACDFYMLQPPVTGTETKVASSFQEIARCYAEQIMVRGLPGALAGFSVGGIAALETARLLQAKQFPVTQLCLVDAAYPGRMLRSAIFWRSMKWLACHLNAQEFSMNGRHLGALFSDPGLLGQINAMADYHVKPYAGKTVFIRSSGLVRWDPLLFKAWRRILAADSPELVVRGLHGSMFEKLNVNELAGALRSCLDKATTGLTGAVL
ncbi:amino acid adenylation domain-containing protein [Niveibacterium sp. SC-1]|uniref:non-ribosomal peptide synthetase n=1 Tax=Niveibacterium sp. SC-1 TaxID=3135646 RepID=UPI00311ECEE2